MHLADSLWSAATYLASWVTLSHFSKDLQQPLPGVFDVKVHGDYRVNDYPDFKPPGGRLHWEGSDFNCTYPDMPGWESCSTPEDRDCWLKHPDGRRYNTTTNYEIDAPKGIDRYYEFEITDGTYNADGLIATDVKLVNKQYPGPWVQACWGDRIIVNVTNKMVHNGTAIHWHGIRQNISMHMDGVPGVTQCPIAPNDSFVYEFSAVQYGSSWYHSHYSVQYADGLLGPLTIHGPSTAAYDEAKPPLIMSDWFHRSAFAAIHKDKKGLGKPTIVLNGTGDVSKYDYDVTPTDTPKPYTLHFEPVANNPVGRAKQYLLRLINTSFDTAFLFSIDNHLLQIVSADFVPIVPYTRSQVLIGIGQRYNVIVKAEPKPYSGKSNITDGNFWIRTTVVKCFLDPIIGRVNYDRTGILRYNNESEKDPMSESWPDIPNPIPCRDERMDDLKPRLKWTVDEPKNGAIWGQEFDVKFNFSSSPPKAFPLGAMSFEPFKKGEPEAWNPLQINYSDPTFLHLNNLEKDYPWPKSWVVVPENYTEESWIYLALAGVGSERKSIGAHPIHLHGHDFALLQQESNKAFKEENIKLVTDNPPRRDVILLPASGFAIIAFKADNPGNWLMHCHIAFHASFGLALQILERQGDADALWPNPNNSAIQEAQRVCKNWKDWQKNCKNWWPGYNQTLDCYPACPTTPTNNCPQELPHHVFQDDSGI